MIKQKRGVANTVREIVLKNLGVNTTEDINDWFRKSYAGGYRIDGLDTALKMITETKWDKICICGDYDVDGVTSVAQFRLALGELNLPVWDRIPHRFSEGFGLNREMIKEIPDGNNLIITVDNGIAAHDAVDFAKERGFHIIITDHHLPVVEQGQIRLPNADLIIDPNAIAGSADFSGYCGSGIAYRLLKELIAHYMKQTSDSLALSAYKSLIHRLETLAMVGTISDVMELREENYVIVRNGLKRLNQGIAPNGLLALKKRLWLNNAVAADVGFKVGPCLNANGRLSDRGAERSVDLLSAQSEKDAISLAELSFTNNNLRKQQVEKAMNIANAQIEAGNMQDDMPLVVCIPNINEGIIGIIAGKLCEKFGNISMVFTNSDEEGVLKGSARAADGLNLKQLLDSIPDCFLAYGGHEGAAGMSVKESELKAMIIRAKAKVKEYGWNPNRQDLLEYDLEIKNEEVPETLKELSKYAPFGNGNPDVVFKITGFQLMPGTNGKFFQEIGKEGVKLVSEYSQAIAFDMLNDFKQRGDLVLTLYGTLSYNHFKDGSIPQITFLDFDVESNEKINEFVRRLKAKAV